MRLLNELAGNETLLRVRGAQGPDDEQETDRELILRFFAMQAWGSSCCDACQQRASGWSGHAYMHLLRY